MFHKVWQNIRKQQSETQPREIKANKIDFSIDDFVDFLVSNKTNYDVHKWHERGFPAKIVFNTLGRYLPTEESSKITSAIWGTVEKSKFNNEELKELILNSKDPDNFMMAVSCGHINRVRKMIELGADVHFETKKQYSPIYIALVLNHSEMAKLLIDAGANIDFIPKSLVPTLKSKSAFMSSKKQEIEGAKAFLKGLHLKSEKSFFHSKNALFDFRKDALYDINITKTLLSFMMRLPEKKSVPSHPRVLYRHPGEATFENLWNAFKIHFETRLIKDIEKMEPFVKAILEKKNTYENIQKLLPMIEELISSKKCFAHVDSFGADKEKEHSKVSTMLFVLHESLQILNNVERLDWFDDILKIFNKHETTIGQIKLHTHAAPVSMRIDYLFGEVKKLEKNIVSVITFMKTLDEGIQLIESFFNNANPLKLFRDEIITILPVALKDYHQIESILTFEDNDLILQRYRL